MGPAGPYRCPRLPGLSGDGRATTQILEVSVTMSTRAVQATGIDWNRVDAVIFDVDGTLFDHLAMRPSMAAALLRHVLTQRHGWRDLFVVLVFRRVRGRLAITEAGEIGHREFEITSKSTGVSV